METLIRPMGHWPRGFGTFRGNGRRVAGDRVRDRGTKGIVPKGYPHYYFGEYFGSGRASAGFCIFAAS